METKILLAALTGLIFRLYLHFHKAYQKTTKKRGVKFYYSYYLKENSTLIVASFIASIFIHFFIAPYALEYSGYGNLWSPPVSGLVAAGALEIAQFIKLVFMRKVKDKIGFDDKLDSNDS